MEKPPALERFDPLGSRAYKLEVPNGELDASKVLSTALPEVIPIEKTPESVRAAELIRKTVSANIKPKSLTIVVGPYAQAEINQVSNTPEQIMARMLKEPEIYQEACHGST